MVDENHDWSLSGIAFAGCLFIGMGLGILFKHTWAGIMMGLGVGFIVMAILRWKNKA